MLHSVYMEIFPKLNIFYLDKLSVLSKIKNIVNIIFKE
jgi:hypothetical protein